MASPSDHRPSLPLHHHFQADLLEIVPESEKPSLEDYRVFRVLSDALSDLDIRCGSVLRMRHIKPSETPDPYAIVAVCFVWSGALLLRQFVPPRMLITNSHREMHPHLQLTRSLKIIACLDHRSKT
jgi:hypothetical protein